MIPDLKILSSVENTNMHGEMARGTSMIKIGRTTVGISPEDQYPGFRY